MWHYVYFPIVLLKFLGNYVWHYVGIMRALCSILTATDRVYIYHIMRGIMLVLCWHYDGIMLFLRDNG